MKKYIILALILAVPTQVMASTTMTSSEAESMVAQMKTILDQYASKIQALEMENALLKTEISKAGIKIPLSLYSGSTMQTSPTSNNTSATGTVISSSGNTTTGTGLSSSITENLKINFGTKYTGFITRIHAEWAWIQWAYKLPKTAYIWGYEFIKQWSDNNVFVDIVYDIATATNAYDAKILYEYNTGTYQRKLIWFFEFDRTTGYYKTRSGNNPFAGVARTFVQDPLATKSVIPTTVLTGSTNTGSQVNTNPQIPTLAEIEKAYSDKRYLSVISLSNTYLTVNSATYDLLRIRYRTYFIIGKYTESLGEIAKIETIWSMSSTVACDAKVIATYSKDQSLISKYTALCKK